MGTKGLIIMSMGEILIAIGLPLFALSRYVLTPKIKSLQLHGG